MIKRLIILSLLCISSSVAFAQSENYYQMMLDLGIKLAQRPGTNEMLKDYLSATADGADTVTVFFLVPTACPRCEATISPSIAEIKRLRPSEKIVLVVAHEDAQAANIYVDKQHFGEDIRVLDTDNTFDKVFSTTLGGLQGLFIARIDVKNGRMITGGEHSFATVAFYKNFYAVRTPLPYHVYDADLTTYKDNQQYSFQNTYEERDIRYTSCELQLGDYFPAQIRNHPIMKSGELLFLDEMCGGGLDMLQETDGKFRLKCFQQIDTVQRNAFVQFSLADYEANKPYLRYMPLDIIFQPNDEIVMSYSIPKVRVDTINGEPNYGFWNVPTFLHHKRRDEKWQPLSIISNNEGNKWMLQHYRIFPLRKGAIAMSSHKIVWPIEEEVEKGNPQTDPFMDAFYDQENPYAVEVDLDSNKIVRRFGQLEDIFRQTHTGYWFAELVADTHKGNFIYGNQVVGKLYLTSADNPSKTLRTYEVFSLGEAPQADSTLMYKEEYLQVFAPYFNHILEQVTLDNQSINCLVRTGIPGHEDLKTDAYEYIRISRETGNIVERYALPAQLADERLLAYGLTDDDADNLPFYISKRNGKYYLKFIESK